MVTLPILTVSPTASVGFGAGATTAGRLTANSSPNIGSSTNAVPSWQKIAEAAMPASTAMPPG